MADQRSDLTGDEPTMLSGGGGAPTEPTSGTRTRLDPGDVFGAYRIERMLGRGGMGEVYAALHLEQGRTVALKVLNQQLASSVDRARFLREGQLAASISHPNSVYIFGSDEIAGTPVIAMELLSGGTLKDRVAAEGPLAPSAAVDATLEMIAGLEAAHAKGILHRDVKPANCFLAHDGTTKIGDFGLSIPDAARDTAEVTQLTMVGTFHGTPQYAPPEQLKGERLDVRADIYSVGATLHYLLTGKPPFDNREFTALLACIMAEPPASARTLNPRVPRELATVVLACLAKDRAKRPVSYADLAARLRPFASARPTPGTLGLRLVAYLTDSVILNVSAVLALFGVPIPASVTAFVTKWEFAWEIAYFAIAEGIWGAGIGKRLCRLRVTRGAGEPPGIARAAIRATLINIPSLLIFLPKNSWVDYAYPVAAVLLVCTARRKNQYATPVDLVTGTRVVRRESRRAATSSAPATAGSRQVSVAMPQAGQIDAYTIEATLGPTDEGEILLGHDPALKRPVWIHQVPVGSAAVPVAVRDVARSTRLRWLQGRRSDDTAWDAYEAPEGEPFVAWAGTPRPWREVRLVLLDLAREIRAAEVDGTPPPLLHSRLWVLPGHTVKLLSFRAPGLGTDEPVGPSGAQASQPFLAAVARRALEGFDPSAPPDHPVQVPPPASAGALINKLATNAFVSFEEAVLCLTEAGRDRDRVTRLRRLGSIALVLAVFAITTGIALSTIERHPERVAFRRVLAALEAHDKAGDKTSPLRQSLEIAAASRFRPMAADDGYWSSAETAMRARRPLADAALAAHPAVTDAELEKSLDVLRPMLTKAAEDSSLTHQLGRFFGVLLILASGVGSLACMTALALRGGLGLRLAGIALVDRSGVVVSRWRALGRASFLLLPMLPLAGFAIVRFLTGRDLGSWFDPIVIGVTLPIAAAFLIGAVVSMFSPSRGLQDRFAGTWLVPK